MARRAKAIEVRPQLAENDLRVFSRDAQAFLAALGRLAPPQTVREESKAPSAATASIRDGAWKAPLPPPDLADLRTVIAAPLDRKVLLGALNSGARLCLADACDLTPPRWDTLLGGHASLIDRWAGSLEDADGHPPALRPHPSALMLRVRPLDQREPHVKVASRTIPAGLFDAGLYLFHCAGPSIAAGSGPYLALTGISSRRAARRWKDVLVAAESLLGLPLGTVRVAIEIDHPAAIWELDEIIHELRDHAAALFTGGYRYGRQAARTALSRPRGRVSEARFYEKAISGHLVRVAHRRGIPLVATMLIDDAAAEAERAVRAGFDGLIVGSGAEADAAVKVFDADMPTANQIYVTGEDAPALPDDLVKGPDRPRSEDLFHDAIRTALVSFEAALSGRTIPSGMARAEFRCLEVWHWIQHSAKLDTGRRASEELYEDAVSEALSDLQGEEGDTRRYREAEALLRQMVLARTLPPAFVDLAAKKLA